MELPMRIGGQPVITSQPRTVELPFDGSAVGTIFQAGLEMLTPQ